MCNMTKEAPSLAYTTDAVQLLAADGTQKVAGTDAARRSITVINNPDGINPVYIVGLPNQSLTTGIKLKPGAGITLATISAVYVVAPSGGTVYVASETGALL